MSLFSFRFGAVEYCIFDGVLCIRFACLFPYVCFVVEGMCIDFIYRVLKAG